MRTEGFVSSIMKNHLLCSCIGALLIATIAIAQDNVDPCPNDTTGLCLNAEAIKYVNKLRTDRNIPLLAPGSISMFRNAMSHSELQATRSDIFHQNIAQITVGEGTCRIGLSGENVAYHDTAFSKNAAYFCVMEQWLNSQGHRENMLSRTHGTTVIAIYKGPGSRVTCTQTFTPALPSGASRTGECRPSAGEGSPSNENENNSEAEADSNGGGARNTVQGRSSENEAEKKREEERRAAEEKKKMEEADQKKLREEAAKEKARKEAAEKEKAEDAAKEAANKMSDKEKKDSEKKPAGKTTDKKNGGKKKMNMKKSSNRAIRKKLRNLEHYIIKYWRLYRKLARQLRNAKKRRSSRGSLRRLVSKFRAVERKLTTLVQKYLLLQKKIR